MSSPALDNKFPCPACGKQYSWRPQLAGKRAKCTCGSVVQIPKTAPAAAEEFENDRPTDLYDVAEPPPEPIQPLAPAVPAMAPPGSKTIAYQSAPTQEDRKRDRFREANISDPARDLYVPLALLVIGFFATIGWAVHEINAGFAAIVFASFIATFFTAVKTGILLLAAFGFAPQVGISFGRLGPAILKFAAIILFTDAALYWFDILRDMLGGQPHAPRIPLIIFIGRISISTLILAVLISILCRYLFDIDGSDIGTFCIPVAIASRFIGFLLQLLTVALLTAIFTPSPATPAGAGATARGAPPPNAAAAAAGTTTAPAGMPPLTNLPDQDDDDIIATRIHKSGWVREARQWEEALRVTDDTHFAKRMYDAGAKNVYYDFKIGTPKKPDVAYVQLPTNPKARATVIQAIQAYCKEFKIPIDKDLLKDTDQVYIVVDLAAAP